MTQEERDILLKDLSARLPYGVKVQLSTNEVGILHEVAKRICTVFTKGRIIPPDFFDVRINDIKLYLFPLSSLTEEQKEELADIFGIERLTLSFQDLVKTYEDVCEITGSVPDIECDDRSELARLKLIQIYKASNILNDNWKLTPLGTQCAFYPSFMWKEGKLVCGDICHTLYSVSYDPKLCCGKREDAFYIGTHFIDLYRDYLLLE